jgi:hypothetical protein
MHAELAADTCAAAGGVECVTAPVRQPERAAAGGSEEEIFGFLALSKFG